MTRRELGDFLYANCELPKPHAGGMLVRDGANRLALEPGEVLIAVEAIERDIENGPSYPALIAVAKDAEGPFVLVEGHTRATAYCRALSESDEIEVIGGYSPDIASWRFW